MPITDYNQWLRKYRLIVGTFDVSELRCTFNVVKTLDDTPNYSNVAIYNLSKSTIASIKQGDTIILEAGYEGGNYGMIFTGQVVQPLVSLEGGTDLVLSLVSQDGDQFLQSAFVATTLAKGAKPADFAAAAIGAGSIGTGALSDKLQRPALPRGKVMFGKSATYLRKIAVGKGTQFYIEDGKVNIVGAPDYGPNTAVELNPDTGLIGIPNQTDDGVSGKCLINPSIKLNTLVHINASIVNQKRVAEGATDYTTVSGDGVYRIVKLVYEGDTRGDPWYCNFEAITQSGAKPDGLTGSATNPWR